MASVGSVHIDIVGASIYYIGILNDEERKMNEIERMKRGIEQYLKIMDWIGKRNVAEDEEFQHVFNAFYQVRRNQAWRKVYYALMEELKGSNPSIEEVIRFLAEKTEKGSVELSFASKLLHTIDPTKPIYDKPTADIILNGEKNESIFCYCQKEYKIIIKHKIKYEEK